MTTDVAILQEINDIKQMMATGMKAVNSLQDSLFSPELEPHYRKLAEYLAKSNLAPKCYQGKPADLFIAMAMGYKMGIPPEQAMLCIAVINGKPSLYGDEMLAICMRHPSFVDIIEEPIMDGKTVVGYNCTVKRKGMSDKTIPFTLEQAKKAGLLAKGGVWAQYPERMLQMRARAFALRDRFPDVLKGISSSEEVGDYIEAEFWDSDSKAAKSTLLAKEIKSKAEQQQADIIEADIEKPSALEPFIEKAEKAKALLKEKEYTDERIHKAMEYYEVSCIEEMSEESLDHFIIQLQKS